MNPGIEVAESVTGFLLAVLSKTGSETVDTAYGDDTLSRSRTDPNFIRNIITGDESGHGA